MQYINHLLTILLVPVLLFLSACSERKSDARDRYVGKWNIQLESTLFSAQSSDLNEKKVLTQIGEITYGEKPNELHLNYGNNSELTFTIDDFGHMRQLPNEMCSGSIEGNNYFDLYLRWGNGRNGMIHKLVGEKVTRQAGL
ncbi:unnamed protein product [Chrysoparadoxa australica]